MPLSFRNRLLHLARAVLLALFCAGARTPAAAAEPSPGGHEVYLRHCVRCHGEHGEGVPGKHEEPLQGDWSIDRLTRIIDRTMPEDDPDQCTGEEAARVARYIYDAFYSQEARERQQMARVELVRLTNRQYENAVADLVGSFQEDPLRLPEPGGLSGQYFSTRSFNRGRMVFERLDPRLEFDFGFESPDPEQIGPEEFSVRWRGSLIAEDTGEYEVILVTAHGARLWLNDPDTPLIDAGVASGGQEEHRASIRLLGGRAYPLRIELFKSKDSKDRTSSLTLQWKPPRSVVETIPARHLSAHELPPTLVIATPFPPDDASVGYERGVAVSRAWDEAATLAAIEVANHVVDRLDDLADTRPRADDRSGKIRLFSRAWLERAFRRPLTDAQAALFVEAQLEEAGTLEEGVKKVILLSLKSPRFLYLGLAPRPLDGFEVASRLSFGLWDSIPDAELLEWAAKGALTTPAGVRAQAARMLRDPRARSKVRHFLHHWLHIHHLEDLSKDPEVYPGFDAGIIADLRTSLDLFLEDVVWSNESDYRRLLLEDSLYLNDRLAEFYGVPAPAGEAFDKVRLPSAERAGVITHPYLLAAFSYPRSTSPIHRGVFLTRNILGRALNPPPDAVEFKESDFDPSLTMREKVAQLTSPAACQTCHTIINPLGFSLEHYDAVGRYRTSDADRPIDATGEFTTLDGRTIRLTGARDLARFAAQSEQAQTAFVEQLFHEVVKQPALAYGPRVLQRLRQSFVESSYNVKDLLVEIAAVAALHGIQSEPSPSN
jgi:hypothetical protein